MPTKPHFFVVRPGSTTRTDSAGNVVTEPRIVPLIPLDHFPEWMEVDGVSRLIPFEETVGMVNLGTFAAPNDKYRLRFIDLQHVGDDGEGVTQAEASAPSTTTCRTSSQDFGSAAADELHGGRIMERHQMGSLGDKKRSDRHPASDAAPKTKKQDKPCFAWCHRGSCAWGDSCSFAHEMPLTPQGLKAVGLARPPHWWQDANDNVNTSADVNASFWPESMSQSSKKAAKRKKRKHVQAAERSGIDSRMEDDSWQRCQPLNQRPMPETEVQTKMGSGGLGNPKEDNEAHEEQLLLDV
jgi:hypothetical protein